MSLEEDIAEPQFELTVNGEQWKRVACIGLSGPGDRVYSVSPETGRIRFGDGVHGEKPPAGSRIQATYRYGAGAEEPLKNGPAITLAWNASSLRKNEFIGAVIENQVDGIIFRVCREPEVSNNWKWMAIRCRKLKRWMLGLRCPLGRSG